MGPVVAGKKWQCELRRILIAAFVLIERELTVANKLTTQASKYPLLASIY